MRFHITTQAPELAATEVMDYMQTYGGQWIVNAVEDEGYVMARVGTLDGKRLSRSCSPCLCGPFGAVTELRMLAGEMRVARAMGLCMKSSEAGRTKTCGDSWLVNGYTPRGDEIAIVEQLKKDQLPVTELAERLSLPRKRVADLLRKLRTRKCVSVVGMSCTSSGVGQHVYGIAA